MNDATGRHSRAAGRARSAPEAVTGIQGVADRSYREETADGSYFAPLAEAGYLRLTTFKQKGTPVSAPVQGIVDGGRAYFRVWSQSGTVKRLQHIDIASAFAAAGGLLIAAAVALSLWWNRTQRRRAPRAAPVDGAG